jgi:alkylhydroperoxidase family enzyme
MLARFAARYSYDVSYLRAILAASPAGFFKFAAATRLATHREAAPKEALYAAKLVGARHEDCGPCVQLVVDMARAAGVSDSDIDAVLRRDASAMSAPAEIGFRFAAALVEKGAELDAARDAVRARWGDKGVVDLTFATQASRLFPMVKAGLGYARACTKIQIGDRTVAAKAA